MALSNDLIAQLVKATSAPPARNTVDAGATVYGTTVISEDTTYVQIDGSDQLTPVGTTATVSNGDRVSVFIKNHEATITGNLTVPSASSNEVKELGAKIEKMDILIADVVTTKQLEAETARIDRLITAVGSIDQLISEEITVTELLTASNAAIETLKADKIDVSVVEATYATIESLNAANADIYNLRATYADFEVATANKFAANDAAIQNLTAGKADIDFANIGEAAIKNFYATSGIIKDLVIDDGVVAGELVGVTIKGDLIEAGTLKADTLVLKGEDGLYYKLNTNGETVETEQTDENSINGSVILAQSIAATKIAVEDLVAFDATIGGFKIGETSIHSDIKESVDSSIPGIYLDKTGQMAVGDGERYIKYYEDESGEHKLEIMADSITFGTNSSDLETLLDSTVVEVRVEYALGDSPDEPPTTSIESAILDEATLDLMVLDDDGSKVRWSTTMPEWSSGLYIWQRLVRVLKNGTELYGDPVCISLTAGVTGDTLTRELDDMANEYDVAINNIIDAYVKSKTYEDFRVAVETQFNVLSDRVNIKVQEVTAHIEDVNGQLQTQLNSITKYFTFDVDGLTVGKVDNPNKVVIDNDEIAIKVGSNTVQKFDAEGKAIIPDLTVDGNLEMFGYRWSKDSNDNLNFEYAGGET